MIAFRQAPQSHGELIATLKRLDAILEETRVDMTKLRNQYTATFRNMPMTLAWHTSAGVQSLRWRKTDRRQHYFELCTSEMAESILSELTPDLVSRLIAVDRQRIDLNFTYQTAFYLRKRLRQLRDQRSAIKAMRVKHQCVAS